MKYITRQRLRLIVNIALTVFTLFALIISVVAWFSTRQYAEIQSINLSVNRKVVEVLECPQSILFPCATKIDDVSESDFNTHCVVVATYVIKGEGELIAEVDNDEGILGYVWDKKTDSGSYYDVISNAINSYAAEHAIQYPYSYSNLQAALNAINRRPVGETNEDGNTEITIIYWADYNALGSNLNKISNGVYSYEELEFNVDVTFVS